MTRWRASVLAFAGEFSERRECASGLPRSTRRTGTHRLLHRPEPHLSGTIGCCRWQSARSNRRRPLPAGDRNKKPCKGFKTSTKQRYHSWPGVKLRTDPANGSSDTPPEGKNFDVKHACRRGAEKRSRAVLIAHRRKGPPEQPVVPKGASVALFTGDGPRVCALIVRPQLCS